MEEAKITFRGWAGHFCAADSCRFRLNTLVEFGDIKIVVSTVGLYEPPSRAGRGGAARFAEIGMERYFETMAFHAEFENGFWDADVSRQVYFESQWSYGSPEMEQAANDGHHAVVKEIASRLEAGEKFETEER